MPPAVHQVHDYARRIPGFLVFLANRKVLRLIAVLAALALPLSWSLAGTVQLVSHAPGLLILTALEIGLYFHIAGRTADGSDDMSPPPNDRLVFGPATAATPARPPDRRR